MIPKKKDKAYWQGKLDKELVTLVPGGAKKNPSAVWKICKRFADNPKSQPLPRIHEPIASFAVCVPCNQVIPYGTSPGTLATHIHSSSCKAAPGLKAQVSKKKSRKDRKRKSEVINSPPGKKLKQTYLFGMGPPVPVSDSSGSALKKMSEVQRSKFREATLPHDLRVVNGDLRPFSTFEGMGMKGRDQCLFNLGAEYGEKLDISGAQK